MEIIRNFGIQPVLLLAQIVNFLIILYLLQKFFYKPIVKLLEQRKKRIEESLKNADLIEEKLKKTQEQSVQILAEAQKNSQALIASAKSESEKIISQATLEARKQLEEIVNASQVQIEAQRIQMQKKLERETLNLVVEVVKKVLSRTLKPKERQDLTTKALSEIERQVS